MSVWFWNLESEVMVTDLAQLRKLNSKGLQKGFPAGVCCITLKKLKVGGSRYGWRERQKVWLKTGELVKKNLYKKHLDSPDSYLSPNPAADRKKTYYLQKAKSRLGDTRHSWEQESHWTKTEVIRWESTDISSRNFGSQGLCQSPCRETQQANKTIQL